MHSYSLGLCPLSNRYFKTLKHYVSKAGSVSFFRLETSLRSSYSQSLGTTETLTSVDEPLRTEFVRGLQQEECYRKIKKQPRDSKRSA